MTPDDRQALSERLFHIGYDVSATEYLRSLGGIKYTGKFGGRWIAADGSDDSDYVVAKMFLWLYEQRRSLGETGKRFLVEGEDNDEIMFAMMTQSGSSPLIIEIIIGMIKENAKRPGMVIRQATGRVFILAKDVLEVHRVKHPGRDQFTMAMVDNTLKGITIPTKYKRGFVLDEQKGMGQKRWHDLDLEILRDVANRDGWGCDLLTTLIKNKEKK